MRIFVSITLLVFCAVTAASQQSRQTRAQEIAASFNKQKHAVKEKNGVRIEKYKDVRSELVVKPDVKDYSGVYEVPDLGYAITIQVAADGQIQANGSDASRSFRLENARIAGGMLTGRKVYENGSAENFEGVFITRTERNSPTDPGVSMFGLGVVLGNTFEHDGITFERLFYRANR
jgi:hypothetical protein